MKKQCTTCGEEKELADYRKDKTQPSGFQPRCKLCARAAHKSAYTQQYGVKSNVRNKELRFQNAILIREYKSYRGCRLCDERTSCCLEFHHLDPNVKEYGIAQGTTRSWERLLTEIEKCIVLCSNCHKKYHAGLVTLD